MFVAKTLRFAEPDPINDRRVIQFVRNDGVLGAEQRFKQTAIGVEGRGIKNRVLGPEKFRERAFELFVDVLRAADETDTGHAEPVGIERLFGGGDQTRDGRPGRDNCSRTC